MYVDSHCHLSFPELASRVDEIRAAMAAASVDRALCICTTLEEFEEVHALALRHDNFWASVGVHPDSEGVLEPTSDDLVALAARPRVVAIGETGLDYYRLAGRSVQEMAWQRERFRVHIRAAIAAKLPLVVHTRSASADTLAILREEGAAAAGGVFHCFTETMDVARYVPLERCLIETDSPYLAPVPHRGRPNNPAYVVHVAQQLASLKGVAVEEVGAVTSANFDRLFTRVKRGQASA